LCGIKTALLQYFVFFMCRVAAGIKLVISGSVDGLSTTVLPARMSYSYSNIAIL
jgi:hypothetical protein